MTKNLDCAKEYFYKKDYNSALELFLQEKKHYEAGLCFLLLKDVNRAKKYWEKDKKSCPASQFGLCILKFINLETKNIPSFFQTRAFLEIYLNLFLENNLIEWAENLLSCSECFVKANPESFKFIARSLFANGYFTLAITFCKKSLQIFYADPEAFLILAQCQFLLNNLGEALDNINRINNLISDYYPAILFKKIIQEEIAKKNNSGRA